MCFSMPPSQNLVLKCIYIYIWMFVCTVMYEFVVLIILTLSALSFHSTDIAVDG